jgi:hypothetical protein
MSPLDDFISCAAALLRGAANDLKRDDENTADDLGLTIDVRYALGAVAPRGSERYVAKDRLWLSKAGN